MYSAAAAGEYKPRKNGAENSDLVTQQKVQAGEDRVDYKICWMSLDTMWRLFDL